MSDAKKSVTIVIPHFNDKYLPITVSSVADLGYPVLLVDSGSEKEFLDICEALGREYSSVTFVRGVTGDKAYSLSARVARCAFLPETEYIMYLRSRDLISSDYIDVLASLLDANKDAGLACSPIYKMDSNNALYAMMDAYTPGKFLDDNPLERALAYMIGLYFTPVWSLYRKSAFQDMCLYCIQNNGYMGEDLVLMLYCALNYKWEYAEDVQYIARDKFDKSEMLKAGTYFNSYMDQYKLSENERKYPYHRLGNEFMKVLDAFNYENIAEKRWYIRKIQEAFADRCRKNSHPSPF